MIKIKLSKDFTDSPGGRFIEDGPFSGEEFRKDILKPKYLEAVKLNKKLVVDLDDCYGFPSSFLDESFGELSRELDDKNILDNIEIICKEQPGLIEEIRKCIENEKKKK